MKSDMFDANVALLSSRLRWLRKQRGLTRDDLHRELEQKYNLPISADSLGSYERYGGRAKNPQACMGMRTGLLLALAEYYDVSTDWLLGLEGKDAPQIVNQCANEKICPFYKEPVDKGEMKVD